jgi:hypothetical protein
MKFILTLFTVLLSFGAFAQNDSGSVAIHKDHRVDLLIAKQIEINEITTRNARRTGPGFRILVINTNDRNKAYEAKTQIYQSFPELKAYLMYQTPFIKLKVGNFKTRPEAEEYVESLKRLFPTGVYVVRDVIEMNNE